MLTKAMEVSGIEGNYRITCERTMSVLRENRDSLVATLEAFVYDPLISWKLANPTDRRGPEAAQAAKNVVPLAGVPRPGGDGSAPAAAAHTTAAATGTGPTIPAGGGGGGGGSVPPPGRLGAPHIAPLPLPLPSVPEDVPLQLTAAAIVISAAVTDGTGGAAAPPTPSSGSSDPDADYSPASTYTEAPKSAKSLPASPLGVAGEGGAFSRAGSRKGVDTVTETGVGCGDGASALGDSSVAPDLAAAGAASAAAADDDDDDDDADVAGAGAAAGDTVGLRPNMHLEFEAMAASLQDPAMYVTRHTHHTSHITPHTSHHISKALHITHLYIHTCIHTYVHTCTHTEIPCPNHYTPPPPHQRVDERNTRRAIPAVLPGRRCQRQCGGVARWACLAEFHGIAAQHRHGGHR